MKPPPKDLVGYTIISDRNAFLRPDDLLVRYESLNNTQDSCWVESFPIKVRRVYDANSVGRDVYRKDKSISKSIVMTAPSSNGWIKCRHRLPMVNEYPVWVELANGSVVLNEDEPPDSAVQWRSAKDDIPKPPKEIVDTDAVACLEAYRAYNPDYIFDEEPPELFAAGFKAGLTHTLGTLAKTKAVRKKPDDEDIPF